MNLSRLTDRIDPAALKVAVRTAVFMPFTFALAYLLLDPEAMPFAAFGSFIVLAMVTFAGRAGPRLIAWLVLVFTGCVFIVLGTMLSTMATGIGVLVAGLISFLIFYLGIVNPYVAAARTGAVLLLALPLMIEAPDSAIPDRLAGWLLAAAIGIPATWLLWRLPWNGDLIRQSARLCAALPPLIREPDSEDLRVQARKEVWALRRLFLGTPHRPTGATGVSAALASMVEELGWLFGLITIPGAGIDADGSTARQLRGAVADLLAACGEALEGKPVVLPVDPVRSALEQLVDESNDQLVRTGKDEVDEAALRLENEFRLRKLAYAALDTARMVEIATEREPAPGVLGRIWNWFWIHGPRQVRETGRVISEHADLNSSWLRNSIRGAVGIALAVYAADLLSVQNAFWVVLGTLSVLRNNALGTRGSVARALAGTLVGIVIGSIVIDLIGNSNVALWVALPLSVLFAAYAPRALSLGAGQAAFAILVMVLYNLIEPIGWQVAIIRIQDVAIGCAVSLVVGLLIWPRGASALIRTSVGQSLVAAAKLVRARAHGVLGGEGGSRDSAWQESAAASDRLDAVLRQYMDEATGENINPEALMALSAAGLRLRRASEGMGRIPAEPWFEKPEPGIYPELDQLTDEVSGWYIRLGEAIMAGVPPPAALALDRKLPRDLITRFASDPESRNGFGADLAGIWMYENLAYLSELSVRFNQRARELFHQRNPEEATAEG